MQYIRIVHKARRIPNGSWAPAFHLRVVEGNLIRTLGPFSATNSNLTFLTKERAEQWGEATAKEWCARNYPGWPVESVSH
jgi:hypothetical protein